MLTLRWRPKACGSTYPSAASGLYRQVRRSHQYSGIFPWMYRCLLGIRAIMLAHRHLPDTPRPIDLLPFTLRRSCYGAACRGIARPGLHDFWLEGNRMLRLYMNEATTMSAIRLSRDRALACLDNSTKSSRHHGHGNTEQEPNGERSQQRQ